jgi:hypothetical protein
VVRDAVVLSNFLQGRRVEPTRVKVFCVEVDGDVGDDIVDDLSGGFLTSSPTASFVLGDITDPGLALR